MTVLLTSEGPLLWFLNRATGVVVLVALTLSLALGCLGAGRSAGGRLPAFVPQQLHRNLSVLALALTGVHVVTAVADEYVDIRWWQALSPVGASYEPLWLGLGTLAWDLMIVVALTTWARRSLGHRAWHRVHVLGYLAWPIAIAHAAGIGTDARQPWSWWLAAGCGSVVLLASAGRLRRQWRRRAGTAAPMTSADGLTSIGGRR